MDHFGPEDKVLIIVCHSCVCVVCSITHSTILLQGLLKKSRIHYYCYHHGKCHYKCLTSDCRQVTIIIYLSVVGALLLYMLFLLLVDPLIRKHDSYIQPLHNEEDAEVCLHKHKYKFMLPQLGVLISSERMPCVCVCVRSGDASADGHHPGQRKHSTGTC